MLRITVLVHLNLQNHIINTILVVSVLPHISIQQISQIHNLQILLHTMSTNRTVFPHKRYLQHWYALLQLSHWFHTIDNQINTTNIHTDND